MNSHMTTNYTKGMDISVETHNPPRQNKEETENLNIINAEIESAIKTTSTQKSPKLDDFTRESYQTFKGLRPIFLKLFQNIEEGTLRNSSCTKLALLSYPNQTRASQEMKTIDQYP